MTNRLEPRTRMTYRIIARTPDRMSHQRFWPEVEVTRRVTVRHFETWGTDSATYEVVAREVVDVRNGHTREAFAEAERVAGILADRVCREVAEGHPMERP